MVIHGQQVVSQPITISQSTLDSYLQANYFVVDRLVGEETQQEDKKHRVRVGEDAPHVAPILRRHQANSGFIVTAWNPHSVERTRAENDRANQRMLQHELLRDPNIHCYASYGSDDAATWREEGFFIVGLTVQRAQRLCKAFSQNAGVMVSTDRPSELIWHPDAVLPRDS